MPAEQKAVRPSGGRQTAARVDRSRVIIEGVEPEIDCGRFPIKRVIGEDVVVKADLFIDGHEALSCALLHRKKGAARWLEVSMTELVNDRWTASFTVTQLGRYEYTISGWHDPFKGWRRDLLKRLEAQQDVGVDLLIGAQLIDEGAARAPRKEAGLLRKFAEQ